MKRLAFLLLVPSLFLVGCGGSDRQDPSEAARTGTSASTASETERAVAIYSAVVRQLVTKDHTFGRSDPGFKAVYVLDGAVEGAEDPQKSPREGAPAEPFSEAIKAGLRAKLTDLPPITFVRRSRSVIEGRNGGSSPGHVVDDGVLLTLGPIVGGERRVEVGSNLWINGLAGLWTTYVVERRGGEWKLSGTTGPIAIS
jgi:hypothetical protein